MRYILPTLSVKISISNILWHKLLVLHRPSLHIEMDEPMSELWEHAWVNLSHSVCVLA